jgi:hypothetical protein
VLTRLKVLRILVLVLLSACAHETAAPRAPQPVSISAGITTRTIVRTQPTPLVVYVVAIDLAKAPGVLKVSRPRLAPV